jgi:hypothetical protein
VEKPEEFSGTGAITLVLSVPTMEGSVDETGGQEAEAEAEAEADACWLSWLCCRANYPASRSQKVVAP